MPQEFEPFGASAASRVDPALADKLRGRRVLVIDPDELAVRRASDLLARLGCSVVSARSGTEAVQQAQTNAFDAFIIDVRLPDGPAHEWYDRLRTLLPQATPVMMTGFDYDPYHSIPKARTNGLRAVLYKPFLPEQVIAALAEPQPAGTT